MAQSLILNFDEPGVLKAGTGSHRATDGVRVDFSVGASLVVLSGSRKM